MTLRAALNYLKRPEGAEPLPPVPRVSVQAQRLGERYRERDLRPAPEVAAAAAAQVLDRVAANAPRDIGRAVWRDAVWHLWRGTPALQSDPATFELYLRWITKLGRRNAWHRLAQTWCADFHPTRPEAERIGQLLASVPFVWAWARRHQRFQVFDPAAGPERTAREVLKAPGAAVETLAEAGIAPWLLDGGFAEAAFGQALTLVRAIGADAAVQTRLLDKLMPWAFRAVAGGLQLRYPIHRRAVLAALLLPWRESPPPLEFRQRLLGLVAVLARDPRVAPQDWPEAEPAAVLRGLLVDEAIDRFCGVVEALGYENEWAYRRSFWAAYRRAGAIRDARLVAPADRPSPWHGQLAGRKETVLLVDLGSVVAADWSHGGRLHFWRAANPAAPSLVAERYDAAAVSQKSDNRGLAHSRPDLGSWQREAAHWLAREAKIDLSQRDYMPSGWR